MGRASRAVRRDLQNVTSDIVSGVGRVFLIEVSPSLE